MAMSQESANKGEDVAEGKDSCRSLSLDDIKDSDIIEMAKDKVKSRFLQRALLRSGDDTIQFVFSKAEPHFMDLVRDQYGNYLCQKVLEVATSEQFDSLFAKLKPELISLTQDVHGTRAVQKVIEQAVSRSKVQELVAAIPADAGKTLARSVTGFHVIGKLIELLPIAEVEPYIVGLCENTTEIVSLSKDQWGCCVMKKCIDRSEGDLHERIVVAVTDGTFELVQDAFGNYVIQHLVLAQVPKPNPHVTRVIDSLKGRIFQMSLHKFGSNVLEKCLANSSDKDRNKVINEILNPPDYLPSQAVKMLLFHQFGNYVFQQALDGAKEPQFSLLVEHSRASVHQVAADTLHMQDVADSLTQEHAKRLAAKLIKKYPSFAQPTDQIGNVGSVAWDPYGADFYDYGTYGFDFWGAAAYGAWDAQQYIGGHTLPGADAGSKGGKRGKGTGARGSRRNQKQSGARGGSEATDAGRVGRIVGFWPNYTVTYDEVSSGAQQEVASSGVSGGVGGASSGENGKAKGKIVQKAKPS